MVAVRASSEEARQREGENESDGILEDAEYAERRRKALWPYIPCWLGFTLSTLH